MRLMALLIILWTSNLFAQSQYDLDAKVKSMSWQAQEKNYKVALSGHAAVYYALEDLNKCLSSSITDKKNVHLVIDYKKMLILSCK